jgi:hypothetical protein
MLHRDSKELLVGLFAFPIFSFYSRLYCPFGTGLDDVAGVGFMTYRHSRNLSTAA